MTKQCFCHAEKYMIIGAAVIGTALCLYAQQWLSAACGIAVIAISFLSALCKTNDDKFSQDEIRELSSNDVNFFIIVGLAVLGIIFAGIAKEWTAAIGGVAMIVVITTARHTCNSKQNKSNEMSE